MHRDRVSLMPVDDSVLVSLMARAYDHMLSGIMDMTFTDGERKFTLLNTPIYELMGKFNQKCKLRSSSG